MGTEPVITPEDKQYLRDLAKKQLEYARLPIMEERKRRWYAHNALREACPMLVMEMGTFSQSVLPELRCASPKARSIEHQLVTWITNHELIDDDKVVPNVFVVPWQIHIRQFGLDVKRTTARDAQGRALGYATDHPIVDLERDFAVLKPSEFHVDRAGTLARQAFVQDLIGDILPVRIENHALNWFLTPSSKVVHLMGMERMLYALMDTPDRMRELYAFVRDEILRAVAWMAQEGLLTLNNGNQTVGAGSYGFTDRLPTAQHKATGKVTPADLWGNVNSQETVGLSPQMYREFIYPVYHDIAAEFGWVYYGCCEPVHDIWDECISRLPHLRKVSVSPWCDEPFMGERLRGGPVIYSRKPSPNLIGVGSFDPDAYREHIAATLRAARGCTLEIIHRDIYSLVGDRTRAGRAIAIARQAIEDLWE
jgi:hypothetical protein